MRGWPRHCLLPYSHACVSQTRNLLVGGDLRSGLWLMLKNFDFAPNGQKLGNGKASSRAVKYFKIQVRGWTDFDPLNKKLPEIADAIERGGGFLTAIEVLDTRDDLSAISDNVVREGFQNILAARRVLRSIAELPTSLVEDLRAAVNAPAETAKKRAGSQNSELR